MKKFLLILSTILTLTLIILGSTLVISATEPSTSGECGAEGSSLTWSVDLDTGVLTISGEGAMPDYTNIYGNGIGGPWCALADAIKEIVIEDGVTYIGDHAFMSLHNVKNLVIPDSVTRIGNYAFEGCHALRTVDIGDGVKTIGNYAFHQCYNIYQLKLGAGFGSENFDPVASTAFQSCNLLVEIYDLAPYYVQINKTDYIGHSALVVHTDASAESRIITDDNGYVFYYYDDGTYVTAYLLDYVGTDTDLVLPDDVKGKEYRIRANAFGNRQGLTSVSIPETVASIGANAFAGCSAVDTDAYGVQYVGKWLVRCPVAATECIIREDTIGFADEAFKNCTAIEEIVIPDSVVNFGMSAFESCTALKSVVIGDGIKRVGSYAFKNCSSLESITIGKGVTAWGSFATDGCTSLKAIHISDLVQWCNINFENGYNPLYQAGNLYLNGELITDLVIPAEITELKKSAFGGATCLKTVVVHDKVTKIGGAPFGGCTNLESLTVPFLSETIDSTNEYVIGLGYIVGTVPNSLRHVKITAATEIPSRAFYDCHYIQTVELPETLTSINSYAFYNCTSLYRIELPSSLTYIGSQAFNRCEKLIEVYNPTSYTFDSSLNTSYLTVYPKNVYKEEGGSKLVTVDDFVFYCDDEKQEYYLVAYLGNDAEITLPANINNKNYEVYNYALCYCDSITKITIPESVTVIGDYAFRYTNNLTDISVPSTIEKFGAYVFNRVNINVTTQYDNAWYLGNENDPYVVLVKAANSEITSCEIHANTKIIFSQAFSGCYALESITFPDGLTTIGDEVFCRCQALTQIVIPDSVKHLGKGAFVACNSITDLTVGNGIESIGSGSFDTFAECSAIKRVTCPAIVLPHLASGVVESITVTSGSELNRNSFPYTLSSLTTLILPDTITFVGEETFDNLIALNYNKYEGGEYLGSVENPYMILVNAADDQGTLLTTTIHEDTKFIYDEAFYCAGELTSIVIPDSVISIGKFAFYGCSSLTDITFGTGVKSIGYRAFDGCNDLESVTIGENVTRIEEKAFDNCWNLDKVVLPDGISYIGPGALAYVDTIIYCGDSWDSVETGSSIDIKIHDYQFIIDGDKHYGKCTVCQAESEKVAHELDDGVITTYPQHEVPGVTTYSCECGYTETEGIAALDHTFDDYNYTVTKQATHLEEGEKTYYCTGYGCNGTKTEVIPKLEAHEWDWGTTTKEATHLEEGVLTYTCPCGETKTEPIPKSTDHEYTSEITKEPTHTENGITTYTCPCGDSYDLVVDRLYDEHEFDEGVITQEPTHTELGVKTFTCACGEYYTENVDKLPDHTFGDWFVNCDELHSRACACGEYEYENHVFDDEYDDTCDVCGLQRAVEKPTESQTETQTEKQTEVKTEQKDPPKYEDEKEPNNVGGCGSSISGGAFAMMAILMGAAVVLNKKKK